MRLPRLLGCGRRAGPFGDHNEEEKDRQRTHTFRTNTLRNLSICAGAILFAVLIAEIIIKLFHLPIRPYRDLMTFSYPMCASDYLPGTACPFSYRLKRGDEFDITIRFNRLGYRGVYPEKIEKDRTKQRIILLGDSFTLGYGNELEDTFAWLLQNTLEPCRIEVINAGYHDYGSPDAYYAYLKREGLTLQPDLLLFFIYTGDIVVEFLREHRDWLSHDQNSRRNCKLV